jgi:aspartate/methionine/tyrosine aminotransferase
MRKAFDTGRRIAVERLNAMPGFVCPVLEGAFYVHPSIRGVLGRTLGGVEIDSSLTFAEVLLDQANVALVPGEAFGTPGYVRISYALGDDELVEGLERVAALLRQDA